MAAITLAADSTTLTLNNRLYTSLVSGDYLEINPVNAKTAHTNAQDGGVSIQERGDADVHDLVIRVHRFSEDDIELSEAANTSGVTLFSGSVKENYTRDGTPGVETWTLENGSITARPSQVKNDQDGNAVMEYTLRFRTATRSL